MSRWWITILLGILVCCVCLEGEAQQTFRVMEYNVENLFDCRHDSLKHDEEFLPGGVRGWNYHRFQHKLNAIAKVILAASAGQVPDVVGLCEVENDYCLERLVKHSPLREAKYRYVMTRSEDVRGIDVAVLYQPQTFKLITSQSVRIPVNKEIGNRPTRDILHVSGKVVSGDTLDILMCHMPSRAGGKRQSEPYRLWAAECLKRVTDSLFTVRACPYLVIMGDFNDYPSDRSIREVLGAVRPASSVSPDVLYNLMDGRPRGTYRHRGEWGVLDQLIVSGTLLEGKRNLRTSYEQAGILEFPFLLQTDETYGGMKPFRTYRGMRYQGGYSDHLPVFMDITITGF